ncbi:MAG: penicillin-binding protein 2 [Thermaurantiacus tibetensis]|uniref:penicillin-binding protein 2 n=1 Tax=Thermaurantiacus tibetensis TaxID=2759035 RepID=UPI00188F8322|nr:penicillin-binding protein 2 [Thermaurantiacus tibetensis]
MHASRLQQLLFERRALLLGGAQLLAGALLLGRMGWLTLREGEMLRAAAEDNRVALRLIPPRRGLLLDASGRPLAENRPAYGVELIPALAGDLEAALDRIARIVPLAADERAELLENARSLRGAGTLRVASDIGWEAYATLNVELADMAGLQPVRTYVRHYPGGEAFAHALGYVGPPRREEWQASRDPLLLHPGFRVGKDGAERGLDARLRGTPGAERVEVNARGRVLRQLDSRPDTPGETIRLTLDRALQEHLAAFVGDESASVVVIDCTTGGIICLLSMPAFDPNIFSNRIPAALWKTLQADDHKPLLPKATQGLYVPGSTFKMVTALAALAEGVPPTDTVGCGGRYTVGGRSWHCHRPGGHGRVDMQRAIAVSCNVFFYATAHRIGNQAVADMARTLGLGQTFPSLPIPSLRAGIVPDAQWKARRFGEQWSVADTLNTSIGQGYLFVSPLQLGVMTARLASGRVVEPQLLAEAVRPGFAPLPIPPDWLEVVRRGMRDVVNGPGGTARRARLPVEGVEMAGKTGTAQVRIITAAERRRGVRRNESLPWRLRDHGLFVGFAPVEAPRYAVAVVVEHGMSGARAAAPIARQAMTFLFDKEKAETDLARLLAERERRRRAAEEAARRAAAGAAAAAAAAAPPSVPAPGAPAP